jgi:hypothetical protein
MKKTLLALALLAVSACTPQARWVENVEGNALAVSTSQNIYGDIIIVENTSRTWTGSYKGDKEKWPVRKQIMLDVGLKELPRICKGRSTYDEPGYVMEERDAMAYGGGAVGALLAIGLADNKNIPTKMIMNYNCPDGKRASK